MWIQILLVAGIVAIAIIDLRAGAGSARNQALRRLGLLAFVGLAIFSVLFPQWLTWVARNLGVGRGADLVLYGLVIAFLSYLATAHRRAVALERKITVLARKLALNEARLAAEEAAHQPPPAADRPTPDPRDP